MSGVSYQCIFFCRWVHSPILYSICSLSFVIVSAHFGIHMEIGLYERVVFKFTESLTFVRRENLLWICPFVWFLQKIETLLRVVTYEFVICVRECVRVGVRVSSQFASCCSAFRGREIICIQRQIRVYRGDHDTQKLVSF